MGDLSQLSRSAYVAVTARDSFGIGIADAYTRGYTLIADGFPSWEAAQREADHRNRVAGIAPRVANAVTICSMFRPGQFIEVYQALSSDPEVTE